MKSFRIFKRSIRDSFKGVFRNFSLSLASISCITITLIVVAVFLVLSYNVNNFTKLVEQDVTIVAFIDNDADKEKIEDIEKAILTIDNISSENVKYKNKMEISKDMMDDSDVFKDIMGNWKEEDSPIQNTYQIKVDNIKDIDKKGTITFDMPEGDKNVIIYRLKKYHRILNIWQLWLMLCQYSTSVFLCNFTDKKYNT